MDCKVVSVFEMRPSSHPTQSIFSSKSETKQRLPSCNVLCSRLQDGGSLACLPSSCFSSSHVWMWELDHKESWVLKNWCFWTVVLEKTRESPLDWKEIKPVNPEGNQSWIFFERINAETPIHWPPDSKNWFIRKDPDAGKDWRQKEKGMMEDIFGWHHQRDGHEFEQAPAVGCGQGSLACCSPWGHKESDMTEWLRWNELNSLLWSFVFLYCLL